MTAWVLRYTAKRTQIFASKYKISALEQIAAIAAEYTLATRQSR